MILVGLVQGDVHGRVRCGCGRDVLVSRIRPDAARPDRLQPFTIEVVREDLLAMLDLGTLGLTKIVRLQNQAPTRSSPRPLRAHPADGVLGHHRLDACFAPLRRTRSAGGYHSSTSTCSARPRPTRRGASSTPSTTACSASFPAPPKACAACRRLPAGAGARERHARPRPSAGDPRRHPLGPVLTDGTAVSGDPVNVCARVASTARARRNPHHPRISSSPRRRSAPAVSLDPRGSSSRARAPIEMMTSIGATQPVPHRDVGRRDQAVIPLPQQDLTLSADSRISTACRPTTSRCSCPTSADAADQPLALRAASPPDGVTLRTVDRHPHRGRRRGDRQGRRRRGAQQHRIGVAEHSALRLAGPAHAAPDDEDSRTMVINPDSVS